MLEKLPIRVLRLALAVMVLGLTTAFTVDAATAACPNEQLRSELQFGQLPDCRGYEMVTPPFKAGSLVSPVSRSGDGSRLVFRSVGVFAGAEGDEFSHGNGALYESTRTASGWSTEPIVPSASKFPGYEHLDDSADLRSSLWRLRPSSQTEEEGLGSFYRREADGSFVEVGPASPSKPELGGVEYMGASSDLSHMFFEKSTELSQPSGALWPGDGTFEQHKSLYEYAGTGDTEPKLVGVSNQGPLSSNEEAGLLSKCGIELGSTDSADTYNAISANGSVVLFTARECHAAVGEAPVDEIFARVEGSRTVSISEPTTGLTGDCAACDTGSPAPAVFQGASADGAKVYFTTAQELLPGHTSTNLYMYDFNSPAGQKVTPISGGAPAAGVRGVARVSEDGSRVYFVATGLLTTARNVEEEQAVTGADNLYVYEPDPAHSGAPKVAFVATLCSSLGKSGAVTDNKCHGSDSADWSNLDARPVQVTPEGRFLVFLSSGTLTADDVSGASQLFEYDAATGSLVRVSSGQKAPGGYVCSTNGELEEGFNCNGNTNNTAEAPQITKPPYVQSFNQRGGVALSLAVTDNGSAIFFTSADNLTSQVTPGTTNVYEYHAGNVYLVSDGRDAATRAGSPAVQLFGSDRAGDDVFFSTADPLVPQDTDTQLDLYDARAGGGFPAPLSQVACSGDGCQGPLGATLSLPTQGGSETQAAGENLIPPPRAPTGKPKVKHKTETCKPKVKHRAETKRHKRKPKRCQKHKQHKQLRKASRQTTKKKNG